MLYLVVFGIGFLTSGIWFGLQFALAVLFNKKEISKLEMFKPLITGIIPTVLICLWGKVNVFSLIRAFDLVLWGIAILTVVVTSTIIILGTKRQTEKDIHKLLPKCIEAAFMEIPQRAMMQTLTEIILISFGLNGVVSILITALVWCAAQVAQLIILKQKISGEFWIEMLASFVFSIGIGYVFWASKFIPIAMLCHGLERFATNKIVLKRQHENQGF